MIITTTPTVDGQPVTQYFGIVSGDAVMGANVVKDLFAVSMLMVSASGTAIVLG